MIYCIRLVFEGTGVNAVQKQNISAQRIIINTLCNNVYNFG